VNVLVTGATGFVGVHVVEALIEQGHSPAALVRSPGKAAERLPRGPVEIVPGDLSGSDALERAAEGRDAVLHVAGLIKAAGEREFREVNVRGTERLVRAIEKAGRPRFVLVSSLAAAGPSLPGRPLTGNEPARPVTAYGRSKRDAEEVVRASALRWTIVRPPMVYGPWDTEVLKVFRLARSGWAPMFGTGEQELNAVCAPDLGRGIVAAMGESGVERTLALCHPEVFTARSFALEVARAVGKPVRIVPVSPGLARVVLAVTGGLARLAGRATVLDADKASEFFAPAWTADPTPAREVLGWTAAHDLRVGLAATARWYREKGWL